MDSIGLTSLQAVIAAGAALSGQVNLGVARLHGILIPTPWTTANLVNPGLLTVASATARIAYSGPETAMVWLARQHLGPRHVRLNPVIPDYAIDDARPETLKAMQHAARQCLDDQSGALPQFYG